MLHIRWDLQGREYLRILSFGDDSRTLGRLDPIVVSLTILTVGLAVAAHAREYGLAVMRMKSGEGGPTELKGRFDVTYVM